MNKYQQYLDDTEEDRIETHSEDCWKWHHRCAIARAARTDARISELQAENAALREKARRYDVICRISETGTAESFLLIPDEQKKQWFADAIMESSRRKTAEARAEAAESQLAQARDGALEEAARYFDDKCLGWDRESWITREYRATANIIRAMKSPQTALSKETP